MSLQDIKLLQEFLTDDTISMDVLKTIEVMKKQKVLKVHSYSITAPKTEKSRWQTFVKLESGKRKKISSVTENGLYKKLYDYYFGSNIMTLKMMYPEWIKKRRLENVSDRTIKRNDEYWNKYYVDHDIVNVPLIKLSLEQIESYFHEIIRVYDLTVKELSCMKFVFSNMMKFARRKDYISINVFLDVEISTYGCRAVNNRSDSSRVYLPNEKKRLFEGLIKEYEYNSDVTDTFAIYLLFKLGLRIGEVTALKIDDIDFINKQIHIHRMQTLQEDVNGKLVPVVVNYTKMKSPHGNRYLPLSDYEINLFNEVLKINERCNYFDDSYVFIDGDGRTKNREIDNCIRKVCKSVGIEVKSAHDIRRTVASEMYKNGISIQSIRDYLGHADVKTTWTYIYDSEEKEKIAKEIVKSLSSHNGLIVTQKI